MLLPCLNVCNFVTLRNKLVYSYLNHIRSSSNTLLCTLFNSVHFEKCELKKEWDKVYEYELSIMTMKALYIVFITNCFPWTMSNNKAYLILS